MDVKLFTEKYQEIVDTASVGFALIDGDGNIVMANQALADLFGYSRKKLVKNEFSFIDCFAGGLSEYKIFLYRLMMERKLRNYEALLKRKTGETFPVLINSNFVEIEAKEYFSLIFIDITERRQTKNVEKRKPDELGMLRFIVDNAASEIFLIRKDMSLSYVNNSACKSLGYSSKEMLKMKVNHFDLDYTPEIWSKYFQGMKQSRRAKTVETRHVDKNGRIKIKEMTSRYIEQKNRGKEYILGVAIDITEHKALKSELTKSEKRFRELFELAPDGILVISPDDKIVLWNQAAKNILGYGGHELKNMPVQNLFPNPQDIDQIKGLLTKGYGSIRIESTVRKKDGDVFPISITIWPERDIEGKVIFIYWIIRDISKTKEMEKERLELEKLSTTKILLKKSEQEKAELEENIVQNIDTILFPILYKLKSSQSPEISQNYVTLLEKSLKKISSPFLRKLSAQYQKFSPREIEVANLIRSGRATKEIADLLLLTPSAINFHRKNIRKKLGLSLRKRNLQGFLNSLG
jgi:PAS domain S-box-containing protein